MKVVIKIRLNYNLNFDQRFFFTLKFRIRVSWIIDKLACTTLFMLGGIYFIQTNNRKENLFLHAKVYSIALPCLRVKEKEKVWKELTKDKISFTKWPKQEWNISPCCREYNHLRIVFQDGLMEIILMHKLHCFSSYKQLQSNHKRRLQNFFWQS